MRRRRRKPIKQRDPKWDRWVWKAAQAATDAIKRLVRQAPPGHYVNPTGLSRDIVKAIRDNSGT